MRRNEPVTQDEIAIPDGEPLVSRTDTTGKIVFANHVFIEVSGFTENELLGAPHNIVRHPAMPEAAFANLWSTIKAGRPWDGMVKNRAKGGGYYWVRANVTPVLENGAVAGFVSIRSKPSRTDVAAAESAYAVLREGKRSALGLRDGALIRLGWLARIGDVLQSITGRLALGTLSAVVVAALVGWLGFGGMASSNDALRHVYEHDLKAVDQLRSFVDLVRDNRNQIAQLAVALGHGTRPDEALSQREPLMRANLERIDTLWHAYLATDLASDQRAVAAQFTADYARLLHGGIEPALALARQGDGAHLDGLFQNQMPPWFQAVFDTGRKLVDLQIAHGHDAYVEAAASLYRRRLIGACASVAGLAVVLLCGWGLLRTVRDCVGAFESHFRSIVHGKLDEVILTPRAREFWPMAAMLRAMRAHMAYKGWESAEFERRADLIRKHTVEQMAETIEQEAGSAVERVANRTDTMARDAHAMAESAKRMSTNAGEVAHAADQALKNAQLVAAASEELAASIREVSAQVERASDVSRAAAGKGAAARETIRSLAEAGARIESVAQMIAGIAGQTNLLALNATIEAARAGEAGKGFAVVAGEVKALATQTSKATEDISRQVSGLRGVTDATASAIDEIGHTLDDVAHVAVSVAAAMEQQTAATHEIARNIASSNASVQQVVDRISEVSHEAIGTGGQAEQLRTDSGAVAGEITTLRGILVRTIRTATTDADRRLAQRVAVAEACTITLDGDRNRLTGTVRDMSEGGAAIMLPGSEAVAGKRGLLVLDRVPDAQARFEVVTVDADGCLHARFDSASRSRGLQDLMADLLHRAASKAA